MSISCRSFKEMAATRPMRSFEGPPRFLRSGHSKRLHPRHRTFRLSSKGSLTPPKLSDISTFMEISPGFAVDALGALAQEHRLSLFRLLVQAGDEGLAAGAIAERLGVPNSSLSFHLGYLTRAGLISQRREGRSLIYTADYAAMNALVGYLVENCCAGAGCGSSSDCQPTTTERENA